MKFLIILTVLLPVAAALDELEDPPAAWIKFKETYGKTYDEIEDRNRYYIFVDNLYRIDKLNNEAQGLAEHGVNRFTDMTFKEFASQMLNFKPSKGNYSDVGVVEFDRNAAVPTSIDWSSQGATTPVKDQGDCGSCWAFSATEQLESDAYLAGHGLKKVAPQQVVDCDNYDDGCDGGDTPTAFKYIIQAGGIQGETTYPYKARDGRCVASASEFITSMTSWKWAIPQCTGGSCDNQDEDGLKQYIGSTGPAAICVNANDGWQSYRSGILQTKCDHSYNAMDHCVQLVGYNLDGSTPYWKVRNSWASDWGENGYIRLKYGVNQCSVASWANKAVV